jgi:hypothetical protein
MSAEMPAERSVVQLPVDATVRVASFGDVQAVRSASHCPRLRSKAHRMKNVPPALRSVDDATDRLYTETPTVAAEPLKSSAKKGSISIP